MTDKTKPSPSISGTAHAFTYACASQCAEGLHFSAFHLFWNSCTSFWQYLSYWFCFCVSETSLLRSWCLVPPLRISDHSGIQVSLYAKQHPVRWVNRKQTILWCFYCGDYMLKWSASWILQTGIYIFLRIVVVQLKKHFFGSIMEQWETLSSTHRLPLTKTQIKKEFIHGSYGNLAVHLKYVRNKVVSLLMSDKRKYFTVTISTSKIQSRFGEQFVSWDPIPSQSLIYMRWKRLCIN